MRYGLLLVGFLATRAQAFNFAPIRWDGRLGKKFFLTPTVPLDGIATPQQLTLKEKIDSKTPYFTTNRDYTISLDDNGMRWCLEASGTGRGHHVLVNHCTSRPTQKWRWLPQGPIQLEGTNQCIHVNENDNLAKASIGLSECASKATDTWMFEDSAPAPARSSLQGLSSSIFSIGAAVMVAALGLGVWMWRWHKGSGILIASKGRAPVMMDQGGVCLAESTAVRSNEITMTLPSAEEQPNDARAQLIINGPSGIGKGTLIKILMSEYPDNFGFSVSSTTRDPRPGEIDGKDYHFTDKALMQKQIDEGKFVEYANVHTNIYGTSLAALEDVKADGKIAILDIDIQGAQQVKGKLPCAHFVFLAPPSMEVLEKRLRGRGTETEEKIQVRLKNAKGEVEFSKTPGFFDKIVVADQDFKEALPTMRALLEEWYPQLKQARLEAMSAADVVGWYDFEWSGGSFEVCFRPGGAFFCPKFQSPARWEMTGDTIKVNWGKFGQYELKFDASAKTMEGNAIPKRDEPSNWRKAKFNRPLSETEALLIGDGAGTEWDFSWNQGSFKVQFKADGYNHFKCPDFPAHAHWSLDGNDISIFWAQYGNYKLTIDAAAQTMNGGAIKGDESSADWWRKAANPKKLMDQATMEHCEHH